MPTPKRILVALGSAEIADDLLRGIRIYQADHPHLHLVLCVLERPAAHPGRLLRSSIARVRPDGVLAELFWPGARRDVVPGLPVVCVNCDFARSSFPTVSLDQAHIGVLAAEHLLAQGLPHYAFAAVTGYEYGATLRWRGFRDRLARDGHTCHLIDEYVRTPVAQCLTDVGLRDWVAQLPTPIGIHAYFQTLAMRIMWACWELGLRVPEDVAVIGGRDQPAMATDWTPTVSGVAITRLQIGFAGLRLLDSLLHGAHPPQGPLLVPPTEVVARQSSDYCGMRDPEVARIRRAIAEGARHPLVVKELLAHTRLSRRALERRFERHMGHTLHDEIVAAHMDQAQRLLRTTLLSPAEVARQSGYAGYAAFAVAFRRYTGLTATAWRRQAMAMTSPAGR